MSQSRRKLGKGQVRTHSRRNGGRPRAPADLHVLTAEEGAPHHRRLITPWDRETRVNASEKEPSRHTPVQRSAVAVDIFEITKENKQALAEVKWAKTLGVGLVCNHAITSNSERQQIDKKAGLAGTLIVPTPSDTNSRATLYPCTGLRAVPLRPSKERHKGYRTDRHLNDTGRRQLSSVP